MSGYRDPLESYLDRDRLDFNQFGHLDDEPPEVPSQSLANSIKHITSSLASHGFPPIGNLFSNELEEVGKTANSLYALLQQRQRDMSFRTEIFEKLSRADNEKSRLQALADRLNEQKLQLESEVSKLQNTIKSINSKTKEERDKLMTERDDLKRENNRLTHKETQYMHELKKKDASYGKLQEQLRKSLGEKDVSIRNSIELTTNLHTSGPVLFGKNGDSEFSYMISRGYEENQNALLIENQELRSAFEMLQNEVQEMMAQRKETFRKRYSEELGESMPDFSEFDLKEIRPEVFAAPFQSVSEDVVKTFQENIRLFREFMTKADEAALEIDGEDQFNNIKCIKDLKELLKNYRIILKNQENLMQNAILGSRKTGSDQVSAQASRLKLTSDAEIEKSNRFLQEEFANLEAKQQEIEQYRLRVEDTTRKLDEEKQVIAMHRQQMQDERARWELALETAAKLNSEYLDD